MTQLLWLLLLYFLPNPVHSTSGSSLNLDSVAIQKSLVYKQEEVFAGQYPCLPDSSNGTRKLVRFALYLNTNTTSIIRLEPYTNPLRLNYWLYDVYGNLKLRSYLNVTCVRDTACQTEEQFTFFSCLGGISHGCQTILSSRTACQWVDITNLSIYTKYTLSLQLIPSITGLGLDVVNQSIVNVTFIPTALPSGVTVTTANTVISVLVFLVPLATMYIFAMVCICRRDKNIIITYKFTIN